jgi:nicotinamide-nucleotide amidase
MKKLLLFVGNKFILNTPLQDYIVREVEKKSGKLDGLLFFQESDNTLFLELERLLSQDVLLVLVTTRNTFSVVGKLLSTVTSDNQILKEKMLFPSQTVIFEPDSYLLNYQNAQINVLVAVEGEKLPNILLENEERTAIIHLFDEEMESASAILTPLAQTYDVRIDYTKIVPGWLLLRIQGRRYGNISQFITSSKQLLPRKIIAASNIITYIIEQLTHHQKKLTFAESCTGGLLAHYFTKESGASGILEGSLVTYSNALKANWLAVSDLNLENFGAVSREVVSEMTEGALNVSYADYALAVSGIAGPDGGSEYKPVGTVVIGVRSKDAAEIEELFFEGDRNYIQEQSTLYAIKMLLLLDYDTFFE